MPTISSYLSILILNGMTLQCLHHSFSTVINYKWYYCRSVWLVNMIWYDSLVNIVCLTKWRLHGIDDWRIVTVFIPINRINYNDNVSSLEQTLYFPFPRGKLANLNSSFSHRKCIRPPPYIHLVMGEKIF